MCKGKLDYIKKMQMYTCTACVEYYYPNTQTTPLKDVTDTKLRPYSGLMKYPTADADDMPYFEAITLDKQQEEGLENRAYEDQRIQKIHVKGSFSDAILKGALSSKNREDNSDGLLRTRTME